MPNGGRDALGAASCTPASTAILRRAPEILLVDNGSLEPASTLQLRRIAAELSGRLNATVHPVSLAHSDRIDPAELGGVPAERFDVALDRLLAARVPGRETLGANASELAADKGTAKNCEADILVLPLFVAPSHAIVRHVPALIAERRERCPDVRIALADPLFAEGDDRLARIVTDYVHAEIAALADASSVLPSVVLVDHGSPNPVVTAVRDAVARQVRARLGTRCGAFSPASMERRPGAEFDFNEPQLETLLPTLPWCRGPLVIALLFVAPGRHAGPDGDIVRIVSRSRPNALEHVRFTRLLGEHPLLIDILADRARAAARGT